MFDSGCDTWLNSTVRKNKTKWLNLCNSLNLLKDFDPKSTACQPSLPPSNNTGVWLVQYFCFWYIKCNILTYLAWDALVLPEGNKAADCAVSLMVEWTNCSIRWGNIWLLKSFLKNSHSTKSWNFSLAVFSKGPEWTMPKLWSLPVRWRSWPVTTWTRPPKWYKHTFTINSCLCYNNNIYCDKHTLPCIVGK